jgi:hypothetical protein
MKLSSQLLKKIIAEEVAKFGDMESTEDRAADAVDVDADEHGSDKTLEKKIDYIKALKIEERRLRIRLKKIEETRSRILQNI